MSFLKSKVGIGILILIALAAGGVIYGVVRARSVSDLEHAGGAALPETNPFETDTNPFDFYTNPFDEN